MKNHTLGMTAFVVPYYKELNSYTGSVTGTIVMTQLEYWFSKMNGKKFFKFLEPCDQNEYKEGDSWVEELGFTKYEFRTAFNKIGKVYKSKNEYLSSDDPFQGKPYLSYYDRIKRRTYYLRNHEEVDRIIAEWISKKVIKPTSRSGETQSLDVPKVDLGKAQKSTSRNEECQFPLAVDYSSRLQQESTTVDYPSTPYETIVDLFNSICTSLPKVQAVSHNRKKAMGSIWKFACGDIALFKTLFTKAEQSDFLCGRRGSWKAGFDWMIKQENAIKIIEGNYENNHVAPRDKGQPSPLTEQLQSQAVQDFINH